MEYLKNGVSGMIMKPNEARGKIDLPDVEGGDELYANGNIVKLTQAGAAYAKQTETTEVEPDEPEDEPDSDEPDTTEPEETGNEETEESKEGGEK